MTRTFKLSAVAVAAFIAAPAFAAASMDANLELDTKFGNNSRGISQGGRVEFNIAGKAGGDAGFVAGRGTAILNKAGAASVDDMWGQIGTSAADVKLGRFEATEMFAVGKDVYVEDNNGAAHARTNKLRGRMGNSIAHAALTVNAGPASFELGVVESKTGGDVKGFRPVVSFGAGPVAVKLAAESGKTLGTTTAPGDVKFSGFGAVVSASVAGGSVNASFSTRTDKPSTGDVKHTAFGLVGVFGPAGIAYINDKDGSVKQNTFYAAYSLPLFNTGATITPALSTSKAKGSATTSSGAAVRINYAF